VESSEARSTDRLDLVDYPAFPIVLVLEMEGYIHLVREQPAVVGFSVLALRDREGVPALVARLAVLHELELLRGGVAEEIPRI
jgi:hypothetical protein